MFPQFQLDRNPHTDNQNNPHVARAAFIVGCLAMEGLIALDVADRESMNNIGVAAMIVAELLQVTEADPGDMPTLPFMRSAAQVARWNIR